MERTKQESQNKIGSNKFLAALVFVEMFLLVLLALSLILPSLEFTIAQAGAGNVTVQTLLNVGAVYPEILNVSIYGGAAGVDLNPNSTRIVDIFVVARDYNGDGDISNLSVEFFDTVASSYGGSDDNNNHYRNSSCVINYAYGDQYEVSANCTIAVWYYANNQTWNATANVTDNSSRSGYGSDTITINSLLALALPDQLNYGTVNSTQVSDEKIVNVTNAGNVMLNLSLFGYGYAEGDNLSMNCTTGSVKNISIYYERYNLTASNTSFLNITQFNTQYKNLTAAPVVNTFDLRYRTNDTSAMIDEYNRTYWRIYVPIGVAGNCTGNIVFGAVQSAGS